MTKWINNTSQFHQFMLNWIKSPIRVVSSPRNFNFSQFIKLIKLNLEEHVNIIQQQKPIDQLWKKLARKSETPNFMKFENSPSNAWKMKRNWKFLSCNRLRIDRTSIESGRLKPKNFNRNFDWSKNRFDWSKVWKN